MNDPRNQSKRLMRDVRRNAGLPSSASVVKETFLHLGYTQDAMEPNDVVKRFNELLRSLWEETLKTLERYEEQSYASGIPRQLALQHHDSFAKAEEVANRKGFKEGFCSLFSELYPLLRGVFLSVQQGRMARGGKDFELQIEGLFDLANIPYDKQEKRFHTDLMIPSSDL